MWDDDERKGECETRCWLTACSSRKAPRGPPGLTSPSDGWIAINSAICLLYLFHSKMIPGKCESEKRKVEEVRHKKKYPIIVRQDSCAIWQKTNLPNQGHCLLSVAMETMLSCQTETWKTRWRGDYFVITFSPLTPQPSATITSARTLISSGNIGKWLPWTGAACP